MVYLCTREPRCVTDATFRLVILQVWVNQYNILNNNVPFGGKKQSGIGMILYLFDHLSHSCTSVLMHSFSLVGRELGSYALEEYTSVKAVHWNFGEKLEWPLWTCRINLANPRNTIYAVIEFQQCTIAVWRAPQVTLWWYKVMFESIWSQCLQHACSNSILQGSRWTPACLIITLTKAVWVLF